MKETVCVRMDREIVKRIDALAEKASGGPLDISVRRSEVIRALVERGLAVAEADAAKATSKASPKKASHGGARRR